MENTTNTNNNLRVGTVKTQSNRAYTEWVNIDEIIPNPLNPRKDDGVKTEELQSIIKKRGWEIPLTVYRKGKMYVVLSGHRRLFAARAAKNIRQIPVFIVDAPKTHQEEVDRIASAQLAQVDWTALEWGKFTYERWLAWGKPGMKKFSEEIKIPQRTALSYITVLDFFPLEEIESGLNTHQYHMSYLYDLVNWIKKVSALHRSVMDALTEDLIRRVMLDKVANRKASREALRKKDFLERVTDQDLQRFFVDKSLDLEEIMAQYHLDVSERSFHGQMVSMGVAKRSIKILAPKNEEEAKKVLENLKSIEESLKIQLKNIERKYPDINKKDALFDWE